MIEVDLEHKLGAFALDIHFTADRGLTALFGRSGSGKTSVVNAIAGLYRPARGRILVDGRTLTDTERGIAIRPHRRRIGYVFQEGRLFPHLTVRQNLMFGHWFARQARDAVRLDEVVALLGARRPARPAPRTALGRRKAACRARPRALGEPAAIADGRAFGRARRGAQGRDPALYRAAARRGGRADRLCQPLGRRGRAARQHDRADRRRAGAMRSAPLPRCWGAPKPSPWPALPRRGRCSRHMSRGTTGAGG